MISISLYVFHTARVQMYAVGGAMTGPRSGAKPERGGRSGGQEALATSVWSSLAAFVNGHDPTEELRETLGLGRGTGRVRALLAVAAGPLTVAELARQLTIDPPYATLIANELAALGLVERTVDGEDRRRRDSSLSPTLAGRQPERRMPSSGSLLEALLALPLDQLQRLRQAVEKLRDLDEIVSPGPVDGAQKP